MSDVIPFPSRKLTATNKHTAIMFVMSALSHMPADPAEAQAMMRDIERTLHVFWPHAFPRGPRE